MDARSSAGGQIARRRHELGWTQVELAERLGVSPSTVANWERGAAYPKKKLGKVEQVLGIAIEGEPEPAASRKPAISPGLMAMLVSEAETPEALTAAIMALEIALSPAPPPEEPPPAAPAQPAAEEEQSPRRRRAG